MKRAILGLAALVAVAVGAIGLNADRADAAGPVAITGGPYVATAGVPVQFNGSASPNASSYTWSFGDGTVGTGATPIKTYAAAGLYTVTLTVHDIFGLASTAATTVTVGNGIVNNGFVNCGFTSVGYVCANGAFVNGVNNCAWTALGYVCGSTIVTPRVVVPQQVVVTQVQNPLVCTPQVRLNPLTAQQCNWVDPTPNRLP